MSEVSRWMSVSACSTASLADQVAPDPASSLMCTFIDTFAERRPDKSGDVLSQLRQEIEHA
jgi:hypothetical protein